MHKHVLEKIIKMYGDKIDMKYAISINNYHPELLHVDLIISTIDMPFESTYITLHPFLTDRDNRNIRDTIDQISIVKRKNAIKDYLMNFFDERLFYKNPVFHDKEEAIAYLAKDIVSLGYAQDSLFHEVIARENLSSTAFGDIAVPHSLSKNAKNSFISIVISDQPINWGSKSVHIIAFIGVNEDSRKIFSNVFDEIIDILSEPSHVKKLLQVQNFNEFITLIKQLIHKSSKV